MKNFKTLDLAIEFYHLAQKTNVASHLRDQLDRASSSVSLNLAEGNAKYSKKDKMRIYQIAMGSLRECQAILKLASISDKTILESADKLAASIYKLIESHKPKL